MTKKITDVDRQGQLTRILHVNIVDDEPSRQRTRHRRSPVLEAIIHSNLR